MRAIIGARSLARTSPATPAIWTRTGGAPGGGCVKRSWASRGGTGPERAVRIVSLVPSATEIVCALGLSDALVGISQDCDFPPEIRGRPVLSAAIVEPAEPSGLI